MASILLVDNNDDYRTTLKMWLQKKSYEVEEAFDSSTCMDLCRRKRFDLVIADLLMPCAEGIETICMLKNEFCSTKIIAMAGFCPSEESEELTNLAIHYGASDIYRKTSSINELLTKVQSLV